MTAEEERKRLLGGFRAAAGLPCPSGKHKHATKREALAHVISLGATGAVKGRTSAYRCTKCDHWHVGRR